MVARHTVTLANSIVGVSVLAMPFCFKQCGIVLATLSLMTGAIMTRMVCYFLLKSALMSRRRTYEMLAWSTFGHTGKFMVEISIVGFLIGTLIAFMVVIGDLGPEILSEIFSVENNSSLRTIIMTALSLFVALPLGLLRNIDSLSSVSTASVLFYLFLVLKIFSEGIGPLWSGEYLERIHFWKSGGVLQCIPIFSMALSCQTQIFGIYDALPEPSLQKMNEIVKQAVNICTFFYFCVGFFGYIAFSQQNFGGNILLSFSPAWSTQLIKSMFLMSIVFSVPLVVFPCRASLHSMIFKSCCRLPEHKYSLLARKGSTYHQVHDMSTNYIPESRLKFLTVTIVASTLVVGILIPNIELVLGLVGSTTGSVICIIFPSIMFVRVTSKNTTERLLAQVMFFVGVVLMLLTTYATLYAAEQSQVNDKLPEFRVTESLLPLKPILRDDMQLNSPISKLDEGKERVSPPNKVEFHKKPSEKVKIRKEHKASPSPLQVQKISTPEAIIGKISDVQNIGDRDRRPPKQENIQEIPKKVDPVNQSPILVADKHVEKQVNIKSKPSSPSPVGSRDKDKKPIANDVVPPPPKDAKIDNLQPGAGDDTKKEFVDKVVAEAFLKRLEEHQENQKKLLEEQKEILEELKQHHAHDVQDKIEKEKNTEQDGIKVPDAEKPSNQFESRDKEKPMVDNINQNKVASSAGILSSDKIIQEQEKIIAKISENIEKEDKNAKLLEKFEEGLNKEVEMMDGKNDVNQKPVNSPLEESKPLSPQKEEIRVEHGSDTVQKTSDIKVSKRINEKPLVHEVIQNDIDKRNILLETPVVKQEQVIVQKKEQFQENSIARNEGKDNDLKRSVPSPSLSSNNIPDINKSKLQPVPNSNDKVAQANVNAASSTSKKATSESAPKEKKVDREI